MEVDTQPTPPEDVVSSFHSTRFHIASMKDKFQAQAQSDLTQTFSDSAMAQDPGNPTLVEEEISAQVEFFKKIKFKYLEQEAKETFLKLILADDPVQIDREDNNRLEEENKESKVQLKRAKDELEGMRGEVGRKAEEVASGHAQLTNDIHETEHLTREIREMELELARLRTTVPVSERMTITEANSLLDEQIVEIQSLADEVDSKGAMVDETKRDLSRLVKVVDRLAPLLTSAQSQALAAKARSDSESSTSDAARIESICRWYTALLSLQKEFLSIESVTTDGPADLKITWTLPAVPAAGKRKGAEGKGEGKMEKVSLVLRFDPGEGANGALVDASLLGSSLDITEPLTQALPGNDVQGLVGDVLSRLRAERGL